MRACRAFGTRLGAALLLAACPPLAASIQPPMTDADLAAGAPLIVVATCTEALAEWHDGRLFTAARLDVQVTLKGPAGSTLDVLVAGGRDGRHVPAVAQLGVGPSTLRVGDSYLLFLVPSSTQPGSWTVYGSAAGSRRLLPGQTPTTAPGPSSPPATEDELLRALQPWLAATSPAHSR